MKKLRVFQKVNQRRTVRMFSLKGICTVLLLLLFLPYIISVLCGNQTDTKEGDSLDLQLHTSVFTVVNRTSLGTEEIPLEVYVADKLSRCMDATYEMEALKAQAVLIRTNLIEGEKNKIDVEDYAYGRNEISKVHLQAAAETKGMILTYEGKPIYGAYFKSSAGCTREGLTDLTYKEHPYLVSVSCGKDYMAEGYFSGVSYSKEQFACLWQQVPKLSAKQQKKLIDANSLKSVMEDAGETEFSYIRDSAGYVLAIGYEGEWASGEEMRYTFLLASANFQIIDKENTFFIEVTGEGHGFGMSQFTANQMAKEGKDFLSVLTYFFEGTELAKIER